MKSNRVSACHAARIGRGFRPAAAIAAAVAAMLCVTALPGGSAVSAASVTAANAVPSAVSAAQPLGSTSAHASPFVQTGVLTANPWEQSDTVTPWGTPPPGTPPLGTPPQGSETSQTASAPPQSGSAGSEPIPVESGSDGTGYTAGDPDGYYMQSIPNFDLTMPFPAGWTDAGAAFAEMPSSGWPDDETGALMERIQAFWSDDILWGVLSPDRTMVLFAAQPLDTYGAYSGKEIDEGDAIRWGGEIATLLADSHGDGLRRNDLTLFERTKLTQDLAVYHYGNHNWVQLDYCLEPGGDLMGCRIAYWMVGDRPLAIGLLRVNDVIGSEQIRLFDEVMQGIDYGPHNVLTLPANGPGFDLRGLLPLIIAILICLGPVLLFSWKGIARMRGFKQGRTAANGLDHVRHWDGTRFVEPFPTEDDIPDEPEPRVAPPVPGLSPMPEPPHWTPPDEQTAASPETPAEEASPADRTAPAAPAAPADHAAPTKPAAPAEPDTSADRTDPAGHTAPADPATSAAHTTPAESASPDAAAYDGPTKKPRYTKPDYQKPDYDQ